MTTAKHDAEETALRAALNDDQDAAHQIVLRYFDANDRAELSAALTKLAEVIAVIDAADRAGRLVDVQHRSYRPVWDDYWDD